MNHYNFRVLSTHISYKNLINQFITLVIVFGKFGQQSHIHEADQTQPVPCWLLYVTLNFTLHYPKLA